MLFWSTGADIWARQECPQGLLLAECGLRYQIICGVYRATAGPSSIVIRLLEARS